VKYWICKSAPPFVYEAMECLGGNGYVEDGILARHYREAPVNAIWEGSGNVMCLDVLRAMSRESDAGTEVLQALIQDTSALTGGPAAAGLIARALLQVDNERTARLAVEMLAKLAAAAALNEIHPPHAELFARTRLVAEPATLYGAADIPTEIAKGLLGRVLPEM
jgi:putative acyl-CoA dehydrogenase